MPKRPNSTSARTKAELRAELLEWQKQLVQMQDSFVNRATQASSALGLVERAIGASKGGTINNAMSQAQGAGSLAARIAELEQELALR